MTADAEGRLIINTPNPEAVIDEITNSQIDAMIRGDVAQEDVAVLDNDEMFKAYKIVK